VYRHSSDVTPDDIQSLTAEVDPAAPGYGRHLTFDRILRRCGQAWTRFLDEIGEGLGTDVIVPRVEVDYLREVGLGGLDVDLCVLSVGTCSFRIGCTVSQGGQPAARVQVVLVRFGYDARTSLPLTDAQRTALGRHLDPR
jgi:acyl-CoA thioesterase FadM